MALPTSIIFRTISAQKYCLLLSTIIVLVLCKLSIVSTSSSLSSTFPTIKDSKSQQEIVSTFVDNLNHHLKEIHYQHYRTVLNLIGPNLVQSLDDQQCLHLLNITFSNPLNYKWTAKMLDSSGSLFASGSLSGTYTSFGDFDSCLSIEHRVDSDKSLSSEFFTPHTDIIRGKYCFVTARLPQDIPSSIDYQYWKPNQNWSTTLLNQWIEIDVKYPLARAICIPSQCNSHFIKQLLIEGFDPLKELDVNIQFCQTKDANDHKTINWSFRLVVVIIVLSTVLILAGLGTAVDISINNMGISNYPKPPQPTWLTALTCFSVVSSAKSLFSVERQTDYRWIDGFRCFFTLWILFSHVSANQSVIQLSQLSPFAHFPEDYLRQASSIMNRYIINSTFLIKSYFMLSGFLLSINALNRKICPSFGRYVFTRWIRFTPTLIGYITFVLLLSLIGTGPLFHESLIEPYVRPCLQNSWMQFLYINNWFDFRESCGFQTWYVSADLQLHILAYLVLMLLYRQNWFYVYITIGLFILLSYLISFVIFVTGLQGIPFFLSVIYPQLPIVDHGYLVYWTATYNHLEAYFLGILVGILAGKRIKFSMSKSTINLLWYLSFATMMSLPLTFPWFLKNFQTKSLLELVNSRSWWDAITMTGSHGLWLLSFAWIFYSITMFYNSPTTTNLTVQFLSAPILAPFSRLCFSIYLVHVPLIWFNVHQSRYPQMRNEFGVIQFSLLAYVDSLLAAIFLYLLFEAPFGRLTKVLFTAYERRRKAKILQFESKTKSSNGTMLDKKLDNSFIKL